MSEERQPWFLVHDPEMAALTDEEVLSHIAAWTATRRRYLEAAEDPDRHGGTGGAKPGYSAWWAGKILDRGIRERARRRQRLLIRMGEDMSAVAKRKRASHE